MVKSGPEMKAAWVSHSKNSARCAVETSKTVNCRLVSQADNGDTELEEDFEAQAETSNLTCTKNYSCVADVETVPDSQTQDGEGTCRYGKRKSKSSGRGPVSSLSANGSKCRKQEKKVRTASESSECSNAAGSSVAKSPKHTSQEAVNNTLLRIRDVKFHKRFKDLPKSETIVKAYHCAYITDVLLQGFLYVTSNNFCFYSNILGKQRHFAIPVAEVTSLTREKTAFIIPNAIAVHTATDKYIFSSLLNRDRTYRLMLLVWNKYHSVRGTGSDGQHRELPQAELSDCSAVLETNPPSMFYNDNEEPPRSRAEDQSLGVSEQRFAGRQHQQRTVHTRKLSTCTTLCETVLDTRPEPVVSSTHQSKAGSGTVEGAASLDDVYEFRIPKSTLHIVVVGILLSIVLLVSASRLWSRIQEKQLEQVDADQLAVELESSYRHLGDVYRWKADTPTSAARVVITTDELDKYLSKVQEYTTAARRLHAIVESSLLLVSQVYCSKPNWTSVPKHVRLPGECVSDTTNPQ